MAAAYGNTNCKYTKLCDLKKGTTVNFYGVVSCFKKPFTTSMGGECLSISITDDSRVGRITCLKCVFFSNHIANSLPKIKSVGDVVVFQEVRIGEFNKCLQGTKTKYFSW